MATHYQHLSVEDRLRSPNGVKARCPCQKLQTAFDLPLVFHPAAAGAEWLFTPVGAG